MNQKVFLHANWRRVASANYQIDPNILEPHLPKGTELEDFDGNHYVSLVAFRYCKTRLYKVRVPYHSSFEEINLRFYVRRQIGVGKWRSEVAFTKLYFPKRALTFVAKNIYKENYETKRMNHQWLEENGEMITTYQLRKKNWHRFKIYSDKEAKSIENGSDADFFSKHYWGTSQINANRCTLYQIEHPEWKEFPVKNFEIDFDFAQVFGSEFSMLSQKDPTSVQLYDGSPVVVYKRMLI